MASVRNTPKDKAGAKADVYEIITNRLLEKMQEGVIPWEKPWHDLGAPRNFLTQRPYTGTNAFLLHFLGEGLPFYLTLKQANQMGGRIREGAKGFPIIFASVTDKKKEEVENDKGEKERRHFVRYATVFNIADVEGLNLILPEFGLTQHDPIEAAEAIKTSWAGKPAITQLNQRAYYVPSADYVNMPAWGSFTSAEAYYQTLFHEFIHATGHPTRLDRPDLADNLSKDAKGYAREELTAEFGAAFLCGVARLNPAITERDSAAYLQFWIGQLQDDKRLLVDACSHAQKAANLILGYDPYSPEAKVLTDRELNEVAAEVEPEQEFTTALAA